MDDKLFLRRKKLPPPASKFAGYEITLRKLEKRRSHFDVSVTLSSGPSWDFKFAVEFKFCNDN